MQAIVLELLDSVALLVLSALVMGVAFDRLRPGLSQDMATGAIGGLSAALAMLAPQHVAGLQIDGRAAILLVCAYFGGPVGALVSLPLPLALRIEWGGAGVVPGVAGMVLAVLVGVLVRRTAHTRGLIQRRWSVLFLALTSPTVLLALLLTPPLPEGRSMDEVILALIAWLPFATAIYGLLVHNEFSRANARHDAAAKDRFLRNAQLVDTDFLASQVEHQARLSERYGVHYAYMLVSVDDSLRLERLASREAWFRMKGEIAEVVRQEVRESDVCGSVAFDRIGVLLPYSGPVAAFRVAERIRANVAHTVRLDGAPVSVSIGLAHVDDVTRPFDVTVAAEGALFMATAVTPFGAIGPRPEANDALIEEPRSFPGQLAA